MRLRSLYIVIVTITAIIVGHVSSIALAPSTVGDVVASAGQISNTIKETSAWKKLTRPDSLVRIFPARAMQVVQEVVGSLRTYKSDMPGTYYSFRGIRYGQAPVGQRRFRAALPEIPWKGVKNALREGSNCPHRNIMLNTYKGNEDCLFLNVYSPRLPTRKNHPQLPVMVWIHGGGFSFGSGNSFLYGPDFLVGEGVVLVTINYRLGALGFLGVGADAPGNAGLKDQVLALRWVQENVAAFGGNPTAVTVFGESAGAASVEFMMISPMAAGLFHRAISQSGSALNPWALANKPKERAFQLGRVLGMKTNDTEKLLAFLRKVPTQKIIDSAMLTLTPDDARKNIGLPFVPSVEENWTHNDWTASSDELAEESFLTEEPSTLLKRGSFNKIPYMTGFNSHEAMLFIRRIRKDPTLLDSIEKDFQRLVPNDLNIPGGRDSSEAIELSKKMREFYLHGRSVSPETAEEMIFLLTDLMFVHGIVESARLHALNQNTNTFLYRFAFDGSLGLYKRLLGVVRPGTCHGDELGYLFHFGVFNLNLDSSAPEVQVKRRMVRMWTNFAKFGTPTPLGRSDPMLGVNWEPVLANGNHSISITPYMDITARLEIRNNPEAERLAFWDSIYGKYNGNSTFVGIDSNETGTNFYQPNSEKLI